MLAIFNTKKLKKYTDCSVKIIPLAVFLFLICNYIFNVGYFTPLGIKYLSLLDIRDYYEGTAALIIFVLFIIFSVFNFLLYTNDLKRFPTYLSCLFDGICTIPIKLLWCKIINIKNLVFHRTKYKNNYKLKKKWLTIQKKLVLIRQKNIKYKIKILKFFKVFIYPLSVVVTPLVLFYLFVYKTSTVLFLAMITMYILYVSLALFYKKINRISFSMFILVALVYLFGIFTFMRNFNYSGTYVNINGDTQLLVRPLSKGVISKKDDYIIYAQWDKVDIIFKEVKLNAK